MVVSKFKKTNFYINLFKGVELKNGYIFTIKDSEEKEVVFTLYKKNNYWILSEYSTGLNCGCSGFCNRQYAIDFILQYDADLFYKVHKAINSNADTAKTFKNKIKEYENKAA